MKPTKPKGHWPKGKRRRPTTRERDTVLAELHTALKTRHERNVCSAQACARAVGVDPRTVRRWLAGTDWPSPVDIGRVARWLAHLPPR